MKDKDINVDLNEMDKQRRENIINSGGYVEISILVSNNSDFDPIVEFESKNCSCIETARAIGAIDALKTKLFKNDPRLKTLVYLMKNDDYDAYKQDTKNGEITKM